MKNALTAGLIGLAGLFAANKVDAQSKPFKFLDVGVINTVTDSMPSYRYVVVTPKHDTLAIIPDKKGATEMIDGHRIMNRKVALFDLQLKLNDTLYYMISAKPTGWDPRRPQNSSCVTLEPYAEKHGTISAWHSRYTRSPK